MPDKTKDNAPGLQRFFCSFGVGAAAAALALCGAATLMAGHGLPSAAAWPLATAAVCCGSLFSGWLFALLQKQRGLLCGAGQGAAFASFLLLTQRAADAVPGTKQYLSLALIVLAGAAGGLVHAFSPHRRKH